MNHLGKEGESNPKIGVIHQVRIIPLEDLIAYQDATYVHKEVRVTPIAKPGNPYTMTDVVLDLDGNKHFVTRGGILEQDEVQIRIDTTTVNLGEYHSEVEDLIAGIRERKTHSQTPIQEDNS